MFGILIFLKFDGFNELAKKGFSKMMQEDDGADKIVQLTFVSVAAMCFLISAVFSIVLLSVPKLSFAWYWPTWTSILLVIMGAIIGILSVLNTNPSEDPEVIVFLVLLFFGVPLSQLVYHAVVSGLLRKRDNDKEFNCCLPWNIDEKGQNVCCC